MTDAEINRALAEKVMGWWRLSGTGWWISGGKGIKQVPEMQETDWHPLTNIAQAFMLPGPMKKKGWTMFLDNIDNWTCVFDHVSTVAKSKLYPVVADTPERAISLAALKAWGVEVE